MRALTLNEKISIKGDLSRHGVLSRLLVGLNMREAIRLYWACCGKPASEFGNPDIWLSRRQPATGPIAASQKPTSGGREVGATHAQPPAVPRSVECTKQMTTVAVSGATPAALNWLVAAMTVAPDVRDGRPGFWQHRNNPGRVCVETYNHHENPKGYAVFSPATDATQGQTLMQRFGIKFQPSAMWRDFQDIDHRWAASGPKGHMATGPTELIAGLRCLVASHFGDVAQVPSSLLQAEITSL